MFKSKLNFCVILPNVTAFVAILHPNFSPRAQSLFEKLLWCRTSSLPRIGTYSIYQLSVFFLTSQRLSFLVSTFQEQLHNVFTTKFGLDHIFQTLTCIFVTAFHYSAAICRHFNERDVLVFWWNVLTDSWQCHIAALLVFLWFNDCDRLQFLFENAWNLRSFKSDIFAIFLDG